VVPEQADIRKLVTEARAEARAMNSPRIEAEHLLLALAARPDLPAGRLLAEQGLDRAALRRALDLEFERSLAAVGVDLASFALPARTIASANDPRDLGQSARLAMQRAMQARTGRGRGRRLTSLHILLGILGAENGTAVRALAGIGAGRAGLMRSARSALEQAA
jgi:ATP-dependent Clp protease ATP-binding subunit ClpA